ncbi:HET domain containing protein [Hyaloscypha variabilis]
MRLLNTTTFELKDFLGESTPEYAILSHTWGEEEIIFQDLSAQARSPDEPWKTKKSFKKVSGFCSLARENGYQWCWIDTCCIDKTSSAELSEPINSMFRWYAQSHVCFVYLSDVRVNYNLHHTLPEHLNGFEESRWHKRGWTLQELLAPAIVEFYDLDWNMAGTRFSLRERISTITGIRTEILMTKFDVEASQNLYCVAEKMSWAADRKTSRVEDLAYCLLGIFDVNMPLLYGEGRRAFERLQFQILAETEDLTLFAWHGSPSLSQIPFAHRSSPEHTVEDLLAQSPSDFHEMTNMYTYRSFDAGSYNRVWGALNRFHKAPTTELRRLRSEFVPEQPVKRLDTVVLSIALLLGPKQEEHGFQESFLILCRIRMTEAGITGTNVRYLCLPVKTRGASMLYWKRGRAKSTAIQKQGIVSEIHYQRISINLRKEPVLSPRYYLSEFARDQPAAFILSMQGQGSSSKQVILCEHRNPPCAILLRHRSAEVVILWGWLQAGSWRDLKTEPWTVITDWAELHTIRNLIPTESKKRYAGDFSQRQLSNGAHVYCSIKPLVQDWCFSHKESIPDSLFQALVERPRIYFALDVLVKSIEGKLEGVDVLGLKVFSDYARLEDWIDESNPSPRDVLLANPQWQREK